MESFAHNAEVEEDAAEFKPLTPEEAQAWRKRHAPVSVGFLLVGQCVVGLLVVLLGWLVWGSAVALSVACGVLAVCVPALLFVRALSSRSGRLGSNSLMLRFVVWELVKVGLTVVMLVLAFRWVPDLNWLALLAGMVLTMKTHWVALAVRPGFLKWIRKEKS